MSRKLSRANWRPEAGGAWACSRRRRKGILIDPLYRSPLKPVIKQELRRQEAAGPLPGYKRGPSRISPCTRFLHPFFQRSHDVGLTGWEPAGQKRAEVPLITTFFPSHFNEWSDKKIVPVGFNLKEWVDSRFLGCGLLESANLQGSPWSPAKMEVCSSRYELLCGLGSQLVSSPSHFTLSALGVPAPVARTVSHQFAREN